MKNINEMELLMFYRERMYVPTNKDDKTKGSVIYFLNTSKESIEALLRNEHDRILNPSKTYKTYYYDFNVNTQIKSKKKVPLIPVSVLRKQRMSQYLTLKDNTAGVKTLIDMKTSDGSNVFYDMNLLTSNIDERIGTVNMSIIDEMDMYFNSISGVINQNLGTSTLYPNKIVMINMDEFDKYPNHFITKFLFLAKKRPRDMAKYNMGMDIILYSNDGIIRFNPSKFDKKEVIKFQVALKRIMPKGKDIDSVMTKELKTKVSKILNNKLGFTGEVDDFLDENSEIVEAISKDVEEKNIEIGDDELDALIDGDEELKKKLYSSISAKNTGEKIISERDKLLREKQKDLKLGNSTIGELLGDEVIPQIEVHEVKNLSTTNANVKTIKFNNFEKTYMEKVYKQDVAKVITSFNNKSVDMNIISIDIQDTSDPLTLKETYTVVYEDERRQRHTLRFNLPKFIDDKFLYVNGNKKVINKQLFAKPVIKTGPDEVQICTNYNKMYIRRYGTKVSPNTEKLRKVLEDPKYNITGVKGDNTFINKDFINTFEYDELSKVYNTIKVGSATFDFNAKHLAELFPNSKNDLDKQLVGYLTVGAKKEPIYYNKGDATVSDLVSLMISYGDETLKKEFYGLSAGKKYIHTKATIMAKNIPVVILLTFFEGLSTVVRKFGSSNVSYTDKKNKGENYMYIKFADGFLCYPFNDIEACMLFNGLAEVNLSHIPMADMDERETYLDIFEQLVGTSYIAGALLNYYDFMIDPITLDILKTLNMPTDLVDLVIYANNLLADNKYSDDIDPKLQRLRSNEIVPAMLYKQLTVAYARYKKTINNPNPVKMSMDENAVIKELVMLPTVEDYSTLNPIVEINKNHLASMKGYVGMNLDRAYTEAKRSYHDNMVGIIGISTDNGPNCGKVRHLTTEPKITNARGFMEFADGDFDKLNDTNLFTPAEMCTTMGVMYDEPVRTAMATKQSGHIVPVAKPCPVLVSNGIEESIHHRISNDFSVVAEDDGVVEDINEKLGLVIVKYKSGKCRAIDISNRVVKNGGGGFYLSNKLQCDLKKGESFKKDSILAYDDKFFVNQGKIGNRMSMGALQKVAVISNYATYEDSTFVTKKMSRDMATDVVMTKSITLGANANVDFIVKKGQEIHVGDELIRFENSYDDSSLNDLLASVRDDLKEDIVSLGKSKIKSKYTGVIEDISIYCTVDTETLSPSLKKIVTDYYKFNKDRRSYLNKFDKENSATAVYKMGVLLDKPDDKVDAQYGKVKGQQVDDGVLIEFNIKYHDELSVGDKLAQFTANKNTIGYVVPEGYEPYTLFRPYEEISTPVAPSAVLQRGTPSVLTTAMAGKIVVELKRKLYEIATGENYNDYMKRQKEKTSVKEHTNDVRIIEDVCDIVFEGEGYTANKDFVIGDVIAPVTDKDGTVSFIGENMRYSSTEYNAVLEDGLVITVVDIQNGEDIIVRP